MSGYRIMIVEDDFSIICPRGDIVDFLWDNQLYVDDNTLSVHMSRIREKLASIGLTGFIKTKHRQGYTL